MHHRIVKLSIECVKLLIECVKLSMECVKLLIECVKLFMECVGCRLFLPPFPLTHSLTHTLQLLGENFIFLPLHQKTKPVSLKQWLLG